MSGQNLQTIQDMIKSTIDPYCGLTQFRYAELKARVLRGILFVKMYFKSSGWILEACSRNFTLHCLRARALKLHEESFLAKFYRRANAMGRTYMSRMQRTVFLGFEIEKGGRRRNAELKALAKLWQEQAFIMNEAIRARSR